MDHVMWNKTPNRFQGKICFVQMSNYKGVEKTVFHHNNSMPGQLTVEEDA